MHKYSGCPSRDHEPVPEGEHQALDYAQAHSNSAENSQDVSEVSSLHAGLRSSSDQVESLQTPDQLLPSPPSSPNNQKLEQPLPNVYSNWKTAWRPHVVIIGSYILSLFCAAAHCWFFVYLDNRILSPDVDLNAKTTAIPQGYATTLSFLLVTGFRAALVASVGVCYTQHLWATLRERVLKVGLIEDLFQIQTNALHLTSPGVYAKTPLLAAIAVFCWLVPIATIYPPGALIVELHTLPVDTSFNVSVLHVEDFTKDLNYISKIGCVVHEESTAIALGPPTDTALLTNSSFLETCTTSWTGSKDAQYITRSCLMSGEIAGLYQPPEGNSTYNLSFWGTALECETINRNLEKALFETDVSVVHQGQARYNRSEWRIPNFFYSAGIKHDRTQRFETGDMPIVHRVSKTQSTYRYYPCLDSADGFRIGDPFSGNVSLPETGIQVILPITETVCHPRIKRYTVQITHVAGEQTVSYLIDDVSHPTYMAYFRDFNGSYEQWVQMSDALTIYNDFAQNLEKSINFNKTLYMNYTVASNAAKSYITNDGTSVETCLLDAGQDGQDYGESNDYDIWPLSVFERRIPFYEDRTFRNETPFDAHLANELLINSTISMLSLNQRFGIVNGTTLRAFSIYRFRNKLSFFLPYGLSLALGIPIIVLGLTTFYVRNQGVSAITGGFLQLLMTTTGRTSLENIVIKGSGTMGGHENVSDELRATEIRLGELVDVGDKNGTSVAMHGFPSAYGNSSELAAGQHGDGHQDDGVEVAEMLEENEGKLIIAGFGMVHEVRPLRRRNV